MYKFTIEEFDSESYEALIWRDSEVCMRKRFFDQTLAGEFARLYINYMSAKDALTEFDIKHSSTPMNAWWS
jgi:hypothetical protein